MSNPLPVPMVLDDREEWFAEAGRGMDSLIARGQSFTADDLRNIIPAPANANWVGALFTNYRAMKLIRKVGYEMARSSSRRGGTLARWKAI